MKFLNRLSTFLIFFLSASLIFAQETPPTGQVLDKIVAKVDNNILLESDVQRTYIEAIAQSQQGIPTPSRCDVFESLMINKLMVAKAEIDSVVVTEAEVGLQVDNRFNAVMQQFGGDESTLIQVYGKTSDQLKAEIEEVIREQLIVSRMRGRITEGITVSPAEVRAFFNSIPKDSLPLFTSEATVGQIVRKPVVNPKVREEIIAQLTKFKNDILAGNADFADLAKRYSQDPGSGSQGGDLGFFRRGELAPEYESTALGLRPGEISDPVETQFGFHMIQLLEIRGTSYNTRHILRIPTASEEDILKAERYLDSLKTEILAGKIDFAKAAKEYSEDRTTSDAGGFFTDPSNNSNRLSLRTLEDPVLYFTIDTMKVGDITPPIRFEDPREGTKVRILYYKARYPAHKANLEDDYEKMKAATLKRKEDEILEKWFVTAKEDVFIDIDPAYDRCNVLQKK
ncbi:periplasmic chaperone for outer membrane proteins SurA [Algoriphagus boseongensis]|uniref:Periplasmic chaperone for outer membrane proteins SurA n=1 Tax=Algoriphagus boseongensis TaxID=1442587 RepID=A0A4R6T4I5_9BACT|nr:peptidylprolyl isomerase [Algoriphagus boseongensis]TDQ13736.1 periplasmic chaperone for outer membrane proteins SurA [Algoriphagus boseongensis]